VQPCAKRIGSCRVPHSNGSPLSCKAVGAYQAGVYQALAEANLHPDWVAGISIGAVNSALVAGNPPEKRVARLREFWETVSTAPMGFTYLPSVQIKDEFTHKWVNQLRAFSTLLWGAPGFFTPRFPTPFRSHPRTSIHLAITTLPL
jgi:NTE family protein